MEKAATGDLLTELGATLERARAIFESLAIEPSKAAGALEATRIVTFGVPDRCTGSVKAGVE